MALALTFPGQGSQKVGMGRDLAEAFPAARDLFHEIDEALKQNLSRLMWTGPDEDLTLTENAQPALMAVSLAIIRVMEAEAGFDMAGSGVRFVAGHSLGEYSALAAARALSVEDTARLLKTRGQAMQKAVPVGEGAMAALLGLDFDTARDVAAKAAENEICTAANDNAPGQVVISGHKAAVDRACVLAKEAGAKRALPLSVSAPFHCALMEPAADAMAQALERVKLNQPVVPLVANVTARPVSDPATIKKLLVDQVTGTVRWRESVAYIADHGVETIIEVGAGKVLTGMARRIDSRLAPVNVESPADIETFLKAL